MPHPLCLAHLSLIELTPPEMVSAAAAAGFHWVSLRIAPAAAGEVQHPMIGDTPMRRETLARLHDLGVAVHDVELVRLRSDTHVTGWEAFIESAACLGARHALVAGDDADEPALAERFAALSELGARYHLQMGLEFMPWRGVRNLGAARRVVRMAGTGGVIVDAIHLDRSGGTAADLAALPPDEWAFFQICDAPAQRPDSEDELLRQARRARLVPGRGGLDLIGMLRAVPDGLTISIETPLHAQPGLLPPVERARLLRAATLQVMERAGVH